MTGGRWRPVTRSCGVQERVRPLGPHGIRSPARRRPTGHASLARTGGNGSPSLGVPGGRPRHPARRIWPPLPVSGTDTTRRHRSPRSRLDGGGRLRYRHRIEALQTAVHIDCWTGATGDPRTWVPPVGPLRSDLGRMLVSHRVEVDFGSRITGALWGAVVWDPASGERAIRTALPLAPHQSAPHRIPARQFRQCLGRRRRAHRLGQEGPAPRHLYGQFLLDELIVSELLGGTEWWGNKYGLLGGLLWTTTWGGWRLGVSLPPGPGPTAISPRTRAYLNGLTPARPSPSGPTSSKAPSIATGQTTSGR